MKTSAVGSRWVSRTVEGALFVTGMIALGCVFFVASAHLQDRLYFEVIESVRMTQARYLNTGSILPPFFEHGYYGATRYLPIPVAFHAAISLVFSDYVFGGKLLALTLGAVTVLAVVALAVRQRVGWALGTGLAGAAAGGIAFMRSTAGLGADLVPVVFQLAGLALVERGTDRRRLVLAGFLCGLAVLSKPSAVWGAAAGGLLLLARRRVDALIFLGSWAVVTGAGIWGLQIASGGTFLEDQVPLLFSSVSLGWGVAFERLISALWGFAGAALVVIALSVGIAWYRRSLTVWGSATLIHLPIALAIFRDPGAAENHLVDLMILGPVWLGALLSLAPEEDRARRKLGTRARAMVGAVLALALCGTIARQLGPPVLDTVVSLSSGTPVPGSEKDPLAEEVSEFDVILSEDAYVPFVRGHRPVVADPYMFARVAADRPGWDDPLVTRIERQEFTKVVLLHDLTEREWFSNYHFGPRVWQALSDNYVLGAASDGYFVYVPGPSR